jgi:hypothetical protein
MFVFPDVIFFRFEFIYVFAFETFMNSYAWVVRSNYEENIRLMKYEVT